MSLIDTHCHLDNEKFDDDLEATLQRAKDAGVERIYLPGVEAPSFPKLLEIADKYPDFVYPMVGIHPTDIGADYKEQLAVVKQYLGEHKFVAVGEIGIDLYWDKTYKAEQMMAFEQQIQMALDHDLPVNIHVRDAFNEAFEVLEKFDRKALRGIFHCFSGSKEIAERVLKFEQFYLGIGGVVTFKNSKLPEVVKHIGLERLVLETDAPYLAPTPHRGKRNESMYLADIADFIGNLFGMSGEKVGEITTQNALKLYGE